MTPQPPTRTQDWLRCPMYAHLKPRWEPRGAVWTPNRLWGTAIGDALSCLYRGGQPPEPQETLRRVILEGYQANDRWDREALIKLAQKGYDRAAEDALHTLGEVLMVDEPLPSRARPDLVMRIPGQGLVVIDTKVTERGGEDRLAEYYTSHQLMHYAWEVGEVLQEPVAWCKIHYVMLTPRPHTLIHPVPVTPARLKFWLSGAQRAWAGMEAPPTPDFTACHGKFGPCEFIPACHDLNLEDLDTCYVQTPERHPA